MTERMEDERLYQLLDGIPVPLAFSNLDAEGRVTFLNPAFREAFGYTLADIPTVEDWARRAYPDPGYRATVMSDWREKVARAVAEQGAVASSEYRVTRKDGQERDVLISAAVLGDRLLGVFLDQTMQKAGERALRRSERRFRELTEMMHDAAWVLDPFSYQYTYVSPSVQRIYGYTTEEMLSLSFDQNLAPEFREAAHELMRQRLEEFLAGRDGETIFYRDEVPHLTRSGVVGWSEAVSRFVRDPETGRLEVQGVTRDITDRKRAEQQALRALEAAETANRVKSEFLARMSHELRTPLHAILGFSDILEGMADDASPAGPAAAEQRHRDMLDGIRRNGRHLLALINDVLDMSRLESGRLDLDTQPTALSDLLRECLANLAPLADAAGLTLRAELDPRLPAAVRIDGRRLTQILTNLLANALRHTPAGQVVLQADAMADDAGRAELRLRVSDTGPGIPLAEQTRIFEPFTQARPPEPGRARTGSGLGLAICRQLAELMGGAIELDSAPGEGSRFTLILRGVEILAAAPEPAPAAGMPAPPPAVEGVPAAPPLPLPDPATLTRLRELAALGLTGRLLDWCQAEDPARRWPDFARGVRERALAFDHAGLTGWIAAARPELPAPRLPGAGAPPPAARWNLILAVDDEPDNLRVCYEHLRQQGLEMAGARDGAEGLRLAALLRPALILLDVGMPGQDGFATCAALKADAATREIPVIFLTARGQMEDKARGFAAGAVDYLPKPFDGRELLLRVSNHLKLARRAAPTPGPEAADAGATEAPGHSLKLVLRARDVLTRDLRVTHDLNQLARLCGTNRTTLQRLFQAHLGMSVMNYLREQRLQRARELIETGLHGVDAAAQAVGYANGSALSRAFRQRFGIRPSDVPRQVRLPS